MVNKVGNQANRDFFISYTREDRNWAGWIAWLVEDCGFTCYLQDWDFGVGTNFVERMHEAASKTERTIAVLSEAYERSAFTMPEWASAFAADPTGTSRRVVPIRVGDYKPNGLLRTIVYCDLVGKSESEATEELKGALASLSSPGQRKKPNRPPAFPGKTLQGNSSANGPMFPPAVRENRDRPSVRQFAKTPALVAILDRARQWGELTTALNDRKRSSVVVVHGASRHGVRLFWERIAHFIHDATTPPVTLVKISRAGDGSVADSHLAWTRSLAAAIGLAATPQMSFIVQEANRHSVAPLFTYLEDEGRPLRGADLAGDLSDHLDELRKSYESSRHLKDKVFKVLVVVEWQSEEPLEDRKGKIRELTAGVDRLADIVNVELEFPSLEEVMVSVELVYKETIDDELRGICGRAYAAAVDEGDAEVLAARINEGCQRWSISLHRKNR